MWNLEKKKGVPVYRSIMELIKDYIREGKLLPGERLPAERKLAEAFEVNRSTVVHALEELSSLGIVIRRQGSGTVVNEDKWGLFTGPSADWRNYLSQGMFQSESPYVTKLQEALRQANLPVIDAYTGELPTELLPELPLPSISWGDFLKEEVFQDDFGYEPLRKTIQESLFKEQAINVSQDQLLITSGAQQALFLIIQVLLQAGDAVAIEDPSFFYPLSIFQAAGIRLYGVPLDKFGMRADILENVILKHKIKLVLLNPTFQNPTGINMPLERRKEIVALCQKHHVPIVEDDVFCSLNFTNKAVIPLKKLDPENVLSIGSLSKVMGSTTKIGWLSAPTQVLKKLAEARREMDFSLSIFPQVLANYALNSPDYPTYMKHLKDELNARQQNFCQHLIELAADSFSWQPADGGYYIWLKSRMKQELTMKDAEQLLHAGLAAAPEFLFGTRGSGIRLNFARLNEASSLEAVQILQRVSSTWK